MLKLSLLIFLIGGSCAFLTPICDFGRCHRLANHFSLFDKENILPDAERLKIICPSIMEVMRCEMRQWDDCLGEALSTLLTSDNETLVAVANVYLSVQDLFNDLCEGTSSFYKDYVDNAVCIKKTAVNPLVQGLCTAEASTLFGGFAYATNTSTERSACMVSAHVFACITGEILNECGETARATIVELIKRTKLLKYAICTMDDLEELKTTYLDYLEQGSERRNIFARAFDLRKK